MKDNSQDVKLQHEKKFPEAETFVFAASFAAVFMATGNPLNAIVFGGLLTLNIAIIYRYAIKLIGRKSGAGP